MDEAKIKLIVDMENYHIGGHLDRGGGVCLHNAGSEKEVFIEGAGDLGIPDSEAWELIKQYWSIDCHLGG